MSDSDSFAIIPFIVSIGGALGGFGLGLLLHALTLVRVKDAQGRKIYSTLGTPAALCLGAVGGIIGADLSLRGWSGWWPVAVVDRLPQFTATALLGALIAGFSGWRGMKKKVGVPLALLARLGASFAIVWWITVTARQYDWETGQSIAWVGGLTIVMTTLWTIASVSGRSMRGPLAALSISLLAGGSTGAVFLGTLPATSHILGVFGIAMLVLAGITLVLRDLGRSPSALGVSVAALLAAWACAWQYADLSIWALGVLALAPLGLTVYPLLGRLTKWKPWLRGLAQLIVIAMVMGAGAGVQYAASQADESDSPNEYSGDWN